MAAAADLTLTEEQRYLLDLNGSAISPPSCLCVSPSLALAPPPTRRVRRVPAALVTALPLVRGRYLLIRGALDASELDAASRAVDAMLDEHGHGSELGADAGFASGARHSEGTGKQVAWRHTFAFDRCLEQLAFHPAWWCAPNVLIHPTPPSNPSRTAHHLPASLTPPHPARPTPCSGSAGRR